MTADLTTALGPVRLATPLVAASGTVGSIVEFMDTIDFSHYGAAVAKSVAPEPWPGRPAPRLGHAGQGMLNGIGIQNPGIEGWLDEVAPRLPAVPTAVWGSVVAHDVPGFAEVAARMSTSGEIDAIEVNLSCPNLDGAPFALDPALSSDVVAAVRSATDLPIGAKLSPDARPIAEVARAVLAAGADWLVVANTVMGASIDVTTRRPVLSGVIGGYSGPPIRPIAIRCILEIRRELGDVPIVGCGGVAHADHAVEFLLTGASAVGIGSAHFDSPRVAAKVRKGIASYMDTQGFDRVADLVGAFTPWP